MSVPHSSCTIQMLCCPPVPQCALSQLSPGSACPASRCRGACCAGGQLTGGYFPARLVRLIGNKARLLARVETVIVARLC